MTGEVNTSEKGHAGEIYIASLLGIALGAESSSTSLIEEGKKIDIKFSFQNTFQKDSMVMLNCQVKYGDSYLGGIKDNFVTLKNIDDNTINALNNGFSVLCWLGNLRNSKVYWIRFDNRTKINQPIRIKNKHYIDPSIRYELSRNYIYQQYQKNIPIINIPSTNINNEIAKKEYRKLKEGKINNKIFGDINISWEAWRHKTRKSRSSKQRISSLNCVKYLKTFLENIPDRYYIADTKIIKEGKINKRINYIICWYSNSISIKGKKYSIMIRLKEEISYSSNWFKHPLTNSDIQYKCTLASWWPKI